MALSRIRASVEISKPIASVTGYGTSGNAAAGQAKALTAWQLPLANVHYILITYGAEVDYRGLNRLPKDISVATDASTLSFSKNVFDAEAAIDEHQILLVKKSPSEALHAAEVRTVSLYRSIGENLDATDDLYGLADADDQETMWLAKSLPIEAKHATDVQHSAIAKPFSEPKTAIDVQTARIDKARTDHTTLSEERTSLIEKPLADGVDAGDELNASFLTDDGETMFMVKPLADEAVHGDQAVLEAGKTSEDAVATMDVLLPFDLGKGVLEDVPTAEAVGLDNEKPLTETPILSDLTIISASLAAMDRANAQREGPNAIADYTADIYFLDDYARTGLPAFAVEKARADNSHTSDLQVCATDKALSDEFISADALIRGASKPLFDSAYTAEIRVAGVSKLLTDYFSKADHAVTALSKTKSDYTQSNDSVITIIGKGINDGAATQEALGRQFSKALSDSVHPTDGINAQFVADDGETMLFATSRAETSALSDLAVKGAGKSLSETVGQSDSGSFRMTSYCDVLYLTSDYVGISSTF